VLWDKKQVSGKQYLNNINLFRKFRTHGQLVAPKTLY
jgi:hypothetical protein